MPDVMLQLSTRLREAHTVAAPQLAAIQELQRTNLERVLAAFHAARVGDEHLAGTTGYGYHDLGREGLERVYADTFGAEAALVRPQIVSGTHAISACLWALLRPGDHLLSITGSPYDTLQQVISGGGPSCLQAHLGIVHDVVGLRPDGSIDLKAVERALTPRTRLVLMQRSRGYSWRPALSVAAMGEAAAVVKAHRPDVISFVDNCYGEFTEVQEPPHQGVDLIAGSLIKNPGGGLAPGGGYVAGRLDLVRLVADRITAPGLGDKVGPTLGLTPALLQGFFLAPHVVGEALAGAVVAAALFGSLGYPVAPGPADPRSDIVQAIRLGHPDAVKAFCSGIQQASALNAHVHPVPGQVPGYVDPVMMAGGTFVQGSSIELSVDAPMREPYAVYLQGGLSLEHVEIGLQAAAAALWHTGWLPGLGEGNSFATTGWRGPEAGTTGPSRADGGTGRENPVSIDFDK